MQTWGSHGDVRPFLALAEGLQAAGHDVTLVITTIDMDAYAQVGAARGVKVVAVGEPIIPADEAAKILRTIYAIKDPMRQVGALMRLMFAPVEDEMFAASRRLCEESDLLIGHHILHPLQVAAEHAGKPYVSVFLSHVSLPTEHAHPLAKLGRTGNRLLWWLTRVMLNRVLLHYPNRLRRQLGMPPARDLLDDVWLATPLALVGVSPAICERRPDWPASVHVCGFLDMPNVEVEGTVPPALDEFLAAGAPPVYMTLGSWMPEDLAAEKETLTLFTAAARLAGCRAIVQSPSAQACGFASDENTLFVTAAPHHLIFPRCAAIVHHGGAGTTQSATLAGKPSIVIAHLNEQEHWASELRRLGIAGKVLKRRSVTARMLADRIAQALATPEMAVKATAVGAAMRKENGVALAVRLIGALETGASQRR
ncbi:glucosyltransferase [Pseudoduganella plicata]|nr:glucosyltransferase [Pseudoduganella plicata]